MNNFFLYFPLIVFRIGHLGTDDGEIRCTQPLPLRGTRSSDHFAPAGCWVLHWQSPHVDFHFIKGDRREEPQQLKAGLLFGRIKNPPGFYWNLFCFILSMP